MSESTPRAPLHGSHGPTNVLTVGDARLQRLLHRAEGKYASLNEYAGATGIPAHQILDLLNEALDRRELDIEAVGGELFLHTGAYADNPNRRTLPANLWEHLRRRADPPTSYALWRIVRGLEQGGWSVEAEPEKLTRSSTGASALGLRVHTQGIAPLLILPELELLRNADGPLTRYAQSGTPLVGVICRSQELDVTVTATRSWLMGVGAHYATSVVVLEEPRYQPVLMSRTDTAVHARSVTIDEIQQR